MGELQSASTADMPIRVVGLDDVMDRRPIPGDTLTGLWPGELRIFEERVADSVKRFTSANRPSFLNSPITKVVVPPNYSGDISDCAAIVLRNGAEDYPQSVNVAYTVKLNPALRGISAGAIKAQYRPGKDPAVDVERQLVRLRLEDDTREAFDRLAEIPSSDDLQLAVAGILRAVSASQPFDGKFKPKPKPEYEELDLLD